VPKKITKITPEQAARFGEWTQKWIEIGLSTEPADFERATFAALKGYELANLKRPMVVLRMGSPYAATLGGALAWAMLRGVASGISPQVESQVWSQVWSQVGSQVESQVGSQVESQVWSQVWSQVESQVGSQVRSQVESQVESQVWSQVESQVRSQVWSQVRSQVGSQVRSQVWSQVWSQVRSQVESQVESQVWSTPYNAYNGAFWASWGAYVSFFRDVMDWNDPALGRFSVDEELIKSCGWVWWHKNVLAISDRPEVIRRDDQGRLHGETGPSIKYRDGWALHHWHGTAVPQEWIVDRTTLTPKLALEQQNVETRRAACEIIGWAKILTELRAKTIDKDIDPTIGELVEVNLPDAGKERFLRVLCGTGREFAIPMPPHIKTALEGNAWSYGVDAETYTPEVRT